MDIVKEEEQRNEFRNILFDLAKSQLSLKEKAERSEIYQRLERLYYSSDKDNVFRHFYSDIFSVLSQIEVGDREGSIEILGQNLLQIRKGYQALNEDDCGDMIDISDRIRKLYDHVSLDIARMRYSDAAQWRITSEKELVEIRAKVYELNDSVLSAQEAQQSVKRELANQQREYIAILGIFAAVVLAFTGGIAFSTSVLNNIAQASIYRTIAVSLVIGLVLVNILFGLFYYVDSLINREKKLWPLVISNAIFLVLLCLLFVAWNSGCVEKRQIRINTGSFRNGQLQKKEFSLGVHLQEAQCHPSFISEI